jgi:hypothetical protein
MLVKLNFHQFCFNHFKQPFFGLRSRCLLFGDIFFPRGGLTGIEISGTQNLSMGASKYSKASLEAMVTISALIPPVLRGSWKMSNLLVLRIEITNELESKEKRDQKLITSSLFASAWSKGIGYSPPGTSPFIAKRRRCSKKYTGHHHGWTFS